MHQNPNPGGSVNERRPPSYSEMDMEDIEQANGPEVCQRPQVSPRSHQGAAEANKASRSMAAARFGVLISLVERKAQLASVLRHGYSDPTTAASIGVGPVQYRIIRGVLQRLQRAYANAGGNMATLERVIRRGSEIASRRPEPNPTEGNMTNWLGRNVLREETEAIEGFEPGSITPQEAMKSALPFTNAMRTELKGVMEELAKRPEAFSMLDSVAANPTKEIPQPPRKAQEGGTASNGKPAADNLSGASQEQQTFLQKAWGWIKRNPLVSLIAALLAGGWLLKRFREREQRQTVNGWPASAMEPAKPKKASSKGR
jgi:hypothetical protein